MIIDGDINIDIETYINEKISIWISEKAIDMKDLIT